MEILPLVDGVMSAQENKSAVRAWTASALRGESPGATGAATVDMQAALKSSKVVPP